MAIEDDVIIDANNLSITYVGDGTTFYTGIELHEYAADLSDNRLGTAGAVMDISRPVATQRRTNELIELVNGFTIDDISARQFFAATIIQRGGLDVFSGLNVIGNLNNPNTELQITQNGVPLENYWGTGINQSGLNLLRLMVKSVEDGNVIDGGRVVVSARHLGDTYVSFPSTLSTTGLSTAAVSTTPDLNNQTDESVIASWASDFGNTEGLNAIDIDNNGTPEEYFSQFTLSNDRTLNDLYEFEKWRTRNDSTETVYGLAGNLVAGISSTIVSADASGLTAPELLTFSNGATAQLYADSSSGLQIQLLTGVNPEAGDTYTSASGGSGSVDDVIARTQSPVYIGSSTGTNIFGAFGVGIAVAHLVNTDQITDLDGSIVSVPNNVVFSVRGLEIGDSVLVTADDGNGEIDREQLTAVGASAGDTTFEVNELIPSDTPAVGTFRAFDGEQNQVFEYASFSGSTFVLVGSVVDDVPAGNGAFITYIDNDSVSASVESFTSVFSGSARGLVVFSRDGGETRIQPFQSVASLTSSGGSSTVIRTSDE